MYLFVYLSTAGLRTHPNAVNYNQQKVLSTFGIGLTKGYLTALSGPYLDSRDSTVPMIWTHRGPTFLWFTWVCLLFLTPLWAVFQLYHNEFAWNWKARREASRNPYDKHDTDTARSINWANLSIEPTIIGFWQVQLAKLCAEKCGARDDKVTIALLLYRAWATCTMLYVQVKSW